MKEAATIIKESLKNVNFNLEDTYCEEEKLRSSWYNATIPQKITPFFSELFDIDEKIIDSIENVNLFTQRKFLKVKSFYQIMYHVHFNGRKTPLHMLTAITIHNISRSNIIITSLNRKGMCVSYDEVIRHRNRLALYITHSCKNAVPLPCHFSPNSFTIASTDNFDHIEDTFSGKQSTHDAIVLFQVGN